MRRRLLFFALPLAGALALAGVAAAENGGISPVSPVSPNGQRITDAYWLILAITGAVFLIVESTLLLFVIRYRRRGRRRDQEPEQVHGDTRIEVAWTVVPVVLLAVIVGFVFYKLPGHQEHAACFRRRRGDEHQGRGVPVLLAVHLPGGRQSINVLTVPKDRVVTLDVTSADVAHSWWVPAFGGKIDAIPGKTNHTWFQAEKAGNYPIRCAEFCGIQHAAMHGFVHVTNGQSRTRGRRQGSVRRRLRVVPRLPRRGPDRARDRDQPDAAGPEGAAHARQERQRQDAGGRPHVERPDDQRRGRPTSRHIRRLRGGETSGG